MGTSETGNKRQAYRLEIRAEAGESVPEIIRLRGIIKSLLRAYGFRVTRLVPVEDGPDETKDERQER